MERTKYTTYSKGAIFVRNVAASLDKLMLPHIQPGIIFQTCMTMEAKSAQVVVIGAGLTGLTTAFTLRRGISVHILGHLHVLEGQIHVLIETSVYIRIRTQYQSGILPEVRAGLALRGAFTHCELGEPQRESNDALSGRGSIP